MLIGLHGKKQAGKDTTYDRLQALYGPDTEAAQRVERVSFADLLYESAARSLGVTIAQLQRWKSDPLVRVRVVEPPPYGTAAELTIREYLQRYGTEAHRDVFGPNFWTSQVDLEHAGKVVVVTDVRFKNEADAVHAAGGYVVRVLGPDDVEGAGDGHASELELPRGSVDFTILNAVRGDGFAHLDHEVRFCMAALLEETRR